MIEKINKDIENINSNLQILPKNSKKNLEKYNEYIDGCIDKYKSFLKDLVSVIDERYDSFKKKYDGKPFEEKDTTIKYNSIKLSDKRVRTSEKLNFGYLFYTLANSKGNLDEVNKILSIIFANFRSAGVQLDESCFTYNEYVNEYMKSFFDNKTNIQDVFNNLFWKDSEILKHIELNIRYLYNKNEKQITDYFNKKYMDFDFHKFIHDHKDTILENEAEKHKNVKYIYDMFYNRQMDCGDFLNEKNISELEEEFLVNKEEERNYENLVKLRKSVYEYKLFKQFEYIITDMKELYTHKEEYKDLVNNKLKDIIKKENNIMSLNKKLERTGFFRLRGDKISQTKTERANIINELVNDYDELDNLKIKETIYNCCTNESTYYDLLKFATYNFTYIVNLVKKNNPEAGLDDIKDTMLELQKYIYDNYIDIINYVTILDNKELDKVIFEKYKLNSINVNIEKLADDQIDKYLLSIDKLILHYDILKLGIDLNDIKFLLDTNDTLKKID